MMGIRANQNKVNLRIMSQIMFITDHMEIKTSHLYATVTILNRWTHDVKPTWLMHSIRHMEINQSLGPIYGKTAK